MARAVPRSGASASGSAPAGNDADIAAAHGTWSEGILDPLRQPR